MQNESNSDKASRRWERFQINVRVRVTFTRNAVRFDASGTAHDISIGGMALFLPKDLNVGETIFATLSMPYSNAVSLVGVVRNRRSFEYGVEFVNPDPQVQRELERNCRALALLSSEKVPEH